MLAEMYYAQSIEIYSTVYNKRDPVYQDYLHKQ